MPPPRKKRRRSRRSNSNSSSTSKPESSVFKEMTDDIKVDAPELDGKYKIIGKIDHGGYAIVYKAIDLNRRDEDDQFVAIKRVHSANVQRDYSNNACIEIQILKDMVNQPYFPTMKEVLVDITSSSYSIIMNYFQHQSFEEYNTKLTAKQTIRYIYVLLLCVHKLSDLGYVHRDIKPGNVLYNFDTNDQLLIDFGLCQSIASIKRKHATEELLFNNRKNRNKNRKSTKRRHSMIPLSAFPSNRNKNKSSNSNKKASKKNKSNSKSKPNHKSNDTESGSNSRKHRRSDISDSGVHNQTLPICIRDGTPGFRAPEIVLKSNDQDAKIDVYNIGLILACIMLGHCNIFGAKSDDQQLRQMIAIYGVDAMQDTANSLNRKLHIVNVDQEGLFMNDGPNGFNSKTFATGYEKKAKSHSGLGYYVKTRLEMDIKDECVERDWHNDVFDLLDKLTACNPDQRWSPKDALDHTVFKTYQVKSM